MNEQIKRILLETVPMEGDDGDLMPSLYTPEQIEKFAWNIIRECIQAVGPDNYTMLTGRAYCTEIAYHFDVTLEN